MLDMLDMNSFFVYTKIKASYKKKVSPTGPYGLQLGLGGPDPGRPKPPWGTPKVSIFNRFYKGLRLGGFPFAKQ